MRLLFLILSLLVTLTGCGRPLTGSERALLGRLHGDSLDTSKIRLHGGPMLQSITIKRQPRPRKACRERILPPPKITDGLVTVRPAAVALFNRVYFRKDLFFKDYLRDYPERLYLLDAMFFAHEMTHIWQWQNRAQTGYHPLKAAQEHKPGADPYLFKVDTNRRFLDYPYEQQASIVEEYVCCKVLDAGAPRTMRLRRLIAQAFPADALDRALAPGKVIMPWDGAERQGICR